MEEESQNSLSVCLKDQDGTLLTTVMLNLSSMDKVKAVVSLQALVPAVVISMNTVPEAPVSEDVLPMVEEVVHATVIHFWTDASSSILLKRWTVIMMLAMIMQDFLIYKFTEEELRASVSLVP